jgi:predicted transporter
MSKKALAAICIISGVVLELGFAVAWSQGIDQQGVLAKYGGAAVMILGLVLFFVGVYFIGQARQEQADLDRKARESAGPTLEHKQEILDKQKNP